LVTSPEVAVADEKGNRPPGEKLELKTGKLRPTIIDRLDDRPAPSSAEGVRGLSESRHLVAPRAIGPTMVPGVERKRIPVDLGELKKLSPGATPGVIERALRLVETYVAEDATERTAVLWGQRSQEDYSDLVSENLSLSRAEPLARATGYLNRMMAILRSIDIEAVGTATRRGGAIADYLRGLNHRIDTLNELEAARVELDQLVKLMRAALGDLLDLKERFQRQSRRMDEIGDDMDAAALAAQFLSDYESKRSTEFSRRFFERSMSLTQSVAQIRGSATVRATQIEQPLRLIDAIQNVALVTLPAWLGAIASLSVLQSERRLTPTETGELARQLRSIVEQMQT